MEPENSKLPFKYPQEALDRKARSEAILAAEGVPFVGWLYPIMMRDVKLRSQEEVAYRALATMMVAVKGEGLKQEIVSGEVKNRGMGWHFSPKERAFIGNPNPSEFDRTQFAWRYEAGWVLLWALGFVEKLERPDKICSPSVAVKIVSRRSTESFLAGSKLRPAEEIVDGADLILRYHWAVRDARLKQQAPPARLDAGVVQERHHAFNWLIGYNDADWDDVTTDT
jgi:Domain of unknown function (DUF4272)